jgi:hypothetical protein
MFLKPSSPSSLVSRHRATSSWPSSRRKVATHSPSSLVSATSPSFLCRAQVIDSRSQALPPQFSSSVSSVAPSPVPIGEPFSVYPLILLVCPTTTSTFTHLTPFHLSHSCLSKTSSPSSKRRAEPPSSTPGNSSSRAPFSPIPVGEAPRRPALPPPSALTRCTRTACPAFSLCVAPPSSPSSSTSI